MIYGPDGKTPASEWPGEPTPPSDTDRLFDDIVTYKARITYGFVDYASTTFKCSCHGKGRKGYLAHHGYKPSNRNEYKAYREWKARQPRPQMAIIP